jgi:carotenoid 1,2-hydratase
MRLVLDPAEEAAHGEWLRGTPGAYEWWYFDALSTDGQWAITCIWFLGNPFSPYYRASALGLPGSPFEHNALFFALYKHGRLHAYHFTRFPVSGIAAGETLPLRLQFGPNNLTMHGDGQWQLSLADENANGRTLEAVLTFTAPPLVAAAAMPTDSDHSWLPIAPFCRVQGRIELREPHNPGAEMMEFRGTGYHDHNWGRLPFDAAIRDWYWARAALEGERSVILYHVQPYQGQAVSHLLLFERGRLLRHDAQAQVRLERPVFNSFGTRYHSRLTVYGADLEVQFHFGKRLDSAPFYVRALCGATVRQGGQVESGQGIGEYLRPCTMSWRLTASAMKARIVAH